MTTRPSTTTRPEMIRLQNTHARGSTSSAVTLRRHQIILQRRIVESQRCSSTLAHLRLQPNYYRPRRRRARRQILSSLLQLRRRHAPVTITRDRQAKIADTRTLGKHVEWNIFTFLIFAENIIRDHKFLSMWCFHYPW